MGSPQLPTDGDLAETSLPHLLLSASAQRFTGVLRLERERTHKAVQFQKGAPVSSESNLASEQLGTQLLDAGRITAADHARVSQYMESKGCKEGVALLGLQLLEPKELFRALKEQVRQRVVACFAWPQAHFESEAREAAPKEVQPFRCDLHALIQEGLATHWGAERMLGALAPHLSRYAQPAPGYTALALVQSFGDRIEELVQELDGQRTLGQAMGPRGNDPPTLAAAWLLTEGGWLRFSDDPIDLKDAEAAPAAAEIEISVTREPEARKPAQQTKAKAPSAAQQNKRAKQAEKLRSEILQKLENLKRLEHYAVLGVDADAEPSAIKRAYLLAAKRYHPDALARLGLNDLKEQASEVFARIAEANEILSNSEKRQHYDDSLLEDGTEIDAAIVAQAETFYRKGEILLGMGDFRGALEYLQNAVDVWPEESVYQSDLAWALYKKRPSQPEEALVHLEKALALDPSDSEGHFRKGLVLRSLGREEEAAEALALAKDLEPRG